MMDERLSPIKSTSKLDSRLSVNAYVNDSFVIVSVITEASILLAWLVACCQNLVEKSLKLGRIESLNLIRNDRTLSKPEVKAVGEHHDMYQWYLRYTSKLINYRSIGYWLVQFERRLGFEDIRCGVSRNLAKMDERWSCKKASDLNFFKLSGVGRMIYGSLMMLPWLCHSFFLTWVKELILLTWVAVTCWLRWNDNWTWEEHWSTPTNQTTKEQSSSSSSSSPPLTRPSSFW